MVLKIFFGAYTSTEVIHKGTFPENGSCLFLFKLSQFLQLFTFINDILFMSIITKEGRVVNGEIDEREERVSSWGCQ